MGKMVLKVVTQKYFFVWHFYTKKGERKEKEIHSNVNDIVFFYHLKIELNFPGVI